MTDPKTAQPLPPFLPIMQTLVAPVRMAVLRAALELDVAELLETHGECDAMARAMGAHPGNLRLLLDALAAMDWVRKEVAESGESYANTDFSRAFLRRSSDTYLGDMVAALSGMEHRNLDRMADLVRNGPPEVGETGRVDDPERWRAAARYLARYHRAGAAEWIADRLAELPEFPAMRRMLDLGGGPGGVCARVLARRPDMTGVLFDLAPVAEVGREEMAAAGLADRVQVIGGDYNADDFGRGYDLVLSSLNLYYAKDLTAFLGRVRAALNPGGVFVSLHEGLTHGRTAPAHHVLARLSLALEGQDVSFDQGVIAKALLDAGFARVHGRTHKTPMGVLELDVARRTAQA
jgi:SAM-dependent methyltransferase